MKEVFADSFYFIAMLNHRDQHHESVVRESKKYSFQLITTSWILVEVADALCRPPLRDLVRRFLQSATSSETLRIEAEGERLQRGLELFSSRPDKEWSLTDCISFAVMADSGITHALTADRHFEQAGFVPMFSALAPN